MTRIEWCRSELRAARTPAELNAARDLVGQNFPLLSVSEQDAIKRERDVAIKRVERKSA